MAITSLSFKRMTIASAITWASGVLFVGLLNIIRPGYGKAFLSIVSSVYPGYHAEPNLVSVLVGTAYAFLDGAIAGFIFSWIYNKFDGD